MQTQQFCDYKRSLSAWFIYYFSLFMSALLNRCRCFRDNGGSEKGCCRDKTNWTLHTYCIFTSVKNGRQIPNNEANTSCPLWMWRRPPPKICLSKRVEPKKEKKRGKWKRGRAVTRAPIIPLLKRRHLRADKSRKRWNGSIVLWGNTQSWVLFN